MQSAVCLRKAKRLTLQRLSRYIASLNQRRAAPLKRRANEGSERFLNQLLIHMFCSFR